MDGPQRLDDGGGRSPRVAVHDLLDAVLGTGARNPFLVTERGDMVLTVVSDDRAAVLTAVAGLPEWHRRATWDRMHDACQRLTRIFALGG